MSRQWKIEAKDENNIEITVFVHDDGKVEIDDKQRLLTATEIKYLAVMAEEMKGLKYTKVECTRL